MSVEKPNIPKDRVLEVRHGNICKHTKKQNRIGKLTKKFFEGTCMVTERVTDSQSVQTHSGFLKEAQTCSWSFQGVEN